MKPEPPEQEFTDRLKTLLDADAGNLDAQTLVRLQAARQRAVAAINRPQGKTSWMSRVSLSTGGLAAAALVVLVVMMWHGDGAQPVPGVQADDWDMLAAGELELFEDLDFYDWLLDADAAS